MTGPGWPTERGWLTIGAWVLFVYVISLVAFVPELDKSQLFTALASGVAGAILRDVFGMWTASTKAGSELASKAMDKLHQQDATPQPVVVTNTPDSPVQTEEARP